MAGGAYGYAPAAAAPAAPAAPLVLPAGCIELQPGHPYWDTVFRVFGVPINSDSNISVTLGSLPGKWVYRVCPNGVGGFRHIMFPREVAPQVRSRWYDTPAYRAAAAATAAQAAARAHGAGAAAPPPPAGAAIAASAPPAGVVAPLGTGVGGSKHRCCSCSPCTCCFCGCPIAR